MTQGIVERLRRTKLGRTDFGGVLAGAVHEILVNPDGPEAAATITKLRERLELTGEFASGPDGIACRDDTINLQDARIAALREENARLTLEFADLQFAYKELRRYMFDKTPERRELVIGRYLDKVAARAALGGRSDG